MSCPPRLKRSGSVSPFADNANSGRTEQSGLATLPLSDWPGVDRPGVQNSAWKRHEGNPVLPNGRIDVHQAADPKVYFDKRLGESGAWVMLYFGTCPLWKGTHDRKKPFVAGSRR